LTIRAASAAASGRRAGVRRSGRRWFVANVVWKPWGVSVRAPSRSRRCSRARRCRDGAPTAPLHRRAPNRGRRGRRRRARLVRCRCGHDPPTASSRGRGLGGEHGDRTHRRQGRRGRLTHARVGPVTTRSCPRAPRPPRCRSQERWSSAARARPIGWRRPCTRPHVADSVPAQWMRPHGCRRAGRTG